MELLRVPLMISNLQQYLSLNDFVALRLTCKELNKKVLATHSTFSIVNKFWKENDQSATYFAYKVKDWFLSPSRGLFIYRITLWYLLGGFILPIAHAFCIIFFLLLMLSWVLHPSCKGDFAGFSLLEIAKNSYLGLPLHTENTNSEFSFRYKIDLTYTIFSKRNLIIATIAWHLTGGLICVIFHCVLGLVQLVSIIGAYNAFAHFRLAKLYMSPFGKTYQNFSREFVDGRPLLLQNFLAEKNIQQPRLKVMHR